MRAGGWGVPAGWVTADEADGGSPALRGWLEARQLLYVLAVKATEPPAWPARTQAAAARRSSTCSRPWPAGLPATTRTGCAGRGGDAGSKPALAPALPTASRPATMKVTLDPPKHR
jgi:hypothetical protein